MKKYDIVILGSGLGGLECGYMLSKKGYNVCILEKNSQLGGCLQTFKRSGITFDTGFHYVGGLKQGQFLYKLFDYFDLLGLPWLQMDEEAFAEIIIDGKSYFFASGFERFVATLAKEFPSQQRQLENYAGFLKQVGCNIEKSFSSNSNNAIDLLEQSAYGFMQKTIDDPLLRDVLSGGSLTMELCRDKLPLYIFAQINSSFIQSAWRLKGGGSLIADKLGENIRQMGGTIITKAKATKLLEKDGRISSVQFNDDEHIEGKYIISNLHPALTLLLMDDSKFAKKMFWRRIPNLQNTYGMFTAHLQLEKGRIPYLNRNICLYKNQDPWDCGYAPNKKGLSALISFQPPQDGSSYTENIDILTPMYWEEVTDWASTAVEKRGDEYKVMKRQKAETCIELAAEYIPNLKGHIEKIYTSTPLTYRDYTGTINGSAYGIRKDHNSMLQTMLTPQTPISNLFFTGQNLSLHGILGVSMTSFFTCAKIVGMENLAKDLHL
ncbi:MAG: NAD(P)/FAD-dependent oxidoreductase [Bacteroidales bacterium]|jgi:all-trans-retinol 13,14-reductase|nr:NAD(P)/FAD-dependent oxidoreductase [Bacteroidales bacterium]